MLIGRFTLAIISQTMIFIRAQGRRMSHHPTQPISDADAGADAEFVPCDEMSVEAGVRDAADPPITELDIRLIAASLYDQGCGHVLADMIEGVRGEEVRRLETAFERGEAGISEEDVRAAQRGVRPPDDAYSPRKLPIRDPEWRKARKKVKRKKCRAERRARMTDEEKAKQIGNLQLWKANNPDNASGRKSSS